MNAATTAGVLVVLAGDRDWRTRAAVAARRDAPVAAHRLLVHDPVWQVTYALGSNSGVDPQVWRVMAQEGSRDLRACLAGQSFTPLPIARLLLTAAETQVRQALASQTRHRRVLEVLLADSRPGVRSDALRNSLATLEDVDRAVQDRHYLVRATAARHLPVRGVDFELLLQDRSELVRDEAADRRANGAAIEEDGRLRERCGNPKSVEVERRPLLELSPDRMAHWPVTPRKPTMKWFKLFAQFHPATDQIPAFVERMWKIAGQVDRDPQWIAWWKPAVYQVLDISFGPLGPPGNLPPPDEQMLSWPLDFPTDDDVETMVQSVTEDALEEFFTSWTSQQLATALHDIATTLRLSAPPSLPRTA